MALFEINVDMTQLLGDLRGLEEKARQVSQRAAAELAPAIHAHLLEEAGKKLKSRRKMFVDALHFRQEGEDTWLIVLDAKARWIDDGMEPHSLVPDLLKSKKAKTAADGSRYMVVPFEHGPGKGPATSTPAQLDLQNTIKQHLKQAQNALTGKKGIPYAKIEKGPDGRPLTGMLHSLDIGGGPVKTGHGPGQGWGAVGAVRQGATGIPFLQGVRIYQKEIAVKGGGTKVQRAIMTFRTVSSKHEAEGRWYHPGLEPTNLMEDAYRWGLDHWRSVVAPKAMEAMLG